MTSETELAAIVRQNPEARELRFDLIDVSDLSPLAVLKNLEVLSVDNCHGNLTDISPLANLTNLRELDLSGHKGIVDIQALRGMIHLESLLLWDCRIVDLSPLQSLIKLKKLQIAGNPATDFSPLLALPISELTLKGRSGIDYSPLGELQALRKLELWQDHSLDACQQLCDVSFVGRLHQLEELDCGVPIVEYSFLKNCLSLKQLTIRLDKLKNLDDFSNLKALEVFHTFRSDSLIDINALAELPELAEVDLGYCKSLATIDALGKCSKLRHFELTDAPIFDITALGKLSELEYLKFSHCHKLDRLGTFAKNQKLHTLWIESGTFSDISGLANLQNLKDLALADCLNITDISVLAGLPNLRHLCLNASTNIKQIRPIAPIINQLDWLELDNCYFDDAPELLIGFETNCADDAREFFGFPRREPPDYEEFE